MTKEELLTCQLTHKHAGNGYACVQFSPEGDDRFVRVMSATVPHQQRQAFLAAISALEVYQLSPGRDGKGNPYPPNRDGLADGSLKVVLSHVLPAKKAATAALV